MAAEASQAVTAAEGVTVLLCGSYEPEEALIVAGKSSATALSVN